MWKYITKIEKNIKGFGPLSTYDTTLRIGSYLGYMPEKVYLHSGSYIGAKNLGLNTNKGYLLIKEFPHEFNKLNELYIEDCLCIYKNELKFFNKNSTRGVISSPFY